MTNDKETLKLTLDLINFTKTFRPFKDFYLNGQMVKHLWHIYNITKIGRHRRVNETIAKFDAYWSDLYDSIQSVPFTDEEMIGLGLISDFIFNIKNETLINHVRHIFIW